MIDAIHDGIPPEHQRIRRRYSRRGYGGSGIRTHEAFRPPAFQAGTMVHSVIPPLSSSTCVSGPPMMNNVDTAISSRTSDAISTRPPRETTASISSYRTYWTRRSPWVLPVWHFRVREKYDRDTHPVALLATNTQTLNRLFVCLRTWRRNLTRSRYTSRYLRHSGDDRRSTHTVDTGNRRVPTRRAGKVF